MSKGFILRILFAFILILSFLFFTKTSTNAQGNPPVDEHFEATVVKVLEKSTIIEENGNKHLFQDLEILGNTGKFKGKTFTVKNGEMDQTGVIEYEAGDKIVVTLTKNISGENILRITDYVRRTPLYILIAIFALLTIIIGGKRGASALLGMVFTFAVLFLFVLPQISHGQNPVLITSLAALVIIPVTFFLSHGFNKKTLSAALGTFIALIIAAFLSNYFIESTHLSGFVSEEASFLDTVKKGAIDIKGLLFAGIVIALLGILEDITVSQAAIVFQLKKANKKLGLMELFYRAMDVGKDHIASMANTLILVYAGASLPLLLLFVESPLPFSTVINFEIIAEEIVRTLVASIALILAVPITTLITSVVAAESKSTSDKFES